MHKENVMKKLWNRFRKKKVEESPPRPESTDDLISFYDANGNKYQVTKSEYRLKVLPGIFERSWNDPQELYNSITMALSDGFLVDCMQPAIRLFETDNIRERGVTILGIVYLKNEKYKEAELLFEEYIAKHGKSGVVLTNLAKAVSFQGNDTKAQAILWESLVLDPNLDNAVQWYAAMANDVGGEEAYVAALEKISQLKGSWYAELWLAKNDLKKGRKSQAIGRYSKILDASCSSDTLLMISGDLGNAGAIEELIDLVYPRYNVENHSVNIAINLIRACLEIKRIDQGRYVLSQIKALKRPDIVELIQDLEQQLNYA